MPNLLNILVQEPPINHPDEDIRRRVGYVSWHGVILWDDKIVQNLEIGDNLQVRNGFIKSYRGEWRINIGKYGKIKRT